MLPALDSMLNLEMHTSAKVRRMTFDRKGNVRGVILDRNRREIFLNPGGSVVLTSGTFGTAGLLLASGMA